jgi:hypothetical protein
MGQQVPLDPSFYPEFQYQTKGFLKDLLGKKREQAQLHELLRGVLQKYSELKKPYFANFFHTIKYEGTESNDAATPSARTNGSYSNRELFREVLIRKGFTELEELPHLLDKLLFTTGFNAAYLGFSNEMADLCMKFYGHGLERRALVSEMISASFSTFCGKTTFGISAFLMQSRHLRLSVFRFCHGRPFRLGYRPASRSTSTSLSSA